MRAGVAVLAGALVLVGAVLVIREVADTSLRRATSDRSRRVELTARVLEHHPVAGVGIGGQPLASKRLSDVRWGVLRRIVLAWCATFPACAVIAFIAALIAKYLWS